MYFDLRVVLVHENGRRAVEHVPHKDVLNDCLFGERPVFWVAQVKSLNELPYAAELFF